MAVSTLPGFRHHWFWRSLVEPDGHGGAADASQQATMWALTYTFLHRHLFRE